MGAYTFVGYIWISLGEVENRDNPTKYKIMQGGHIWTLKFTVHLKTAVVTQYGVQTDILDFRMKYTPEM